MTETDFIESKLDAPVISCRNIWKIFGATKKEFEALASEDLTDERISKKNWTAAVRDASFDISRGEVFVIMGLSGSGKSTVVRCISRLIEPTSGGVQIEGENLLSATDEKLIDIRRQKMGMVFQHFALLPNRDVLGNVAFPLQVQGVGRKEREAKAAEIISLVGLEGREDYFPAELSGGQQQRVGIARSLASDPSIWFLDEPFSALDPLIRADLQDELLRLQAQLSKTIVFITHDLDEALRIGDKIAILRDGEVIQQGDPQSIIMRPADDYIADFIKDINRGRVLEVRSVMEKVTRATGPKMSTTTPLEDALQQLLNAGKDSGAVVGDNGKTLGRISMKNAIAAMARPDRDEEGPRYK